MLGANLEKVKIMDKVYVVIKHVNLIDTDEVEIVCVNKSRHNAYLHLLMEAENQYEEYELMEESDWYIRFTDLDKCILIELKIEETEVIDW